MAQKSVYGVCKLCLKRKQLQKSHYIPRALYNLCRPQEGNPIVVTSSVVKASPKQMWKHLLCSDCEQTFSKRGEDYSLDMVFRTDRFSLLDKIRLAVPFSLSGETPMYSGTQLGIKTHKLAYFALSLAWRGAQGPWQSGGGEIAGISLGQFEEPIREYLCGNVQWPENIAVLTKACTDRASQEWVLPPWQLPIDIKEWKIRGVDLWIPMLVRGVSFFVLGGDLPHPIDDWCCVSSSEKVLFLGDHSRCLLSACVDFLETAADRTAVSHLH